MASKSSTWPNKKISNFNIKTPKNLDNLNHIPTDRTLKHKCTILDKFQLLPALTN